MQRDVFRLLIRLLLCFGPILLLPGPAQAAADQTEPGASGRSLPLLNPPGTPYRTPLAGEGFRTEVFGRAVTVEPRDRRTVSAWDLGVSLYVPDPENEETFPFGVISLWRHPDDASLLRAHIAGLYNDIFLTQKFSPASPFEWALTWRNYTVPFAQAELVDGRSLDAHELKWGYVRAGLGIGSRAQTAPGRQDNMTAVDLLIEPGYLYFASSSQTAPDFVVPHDSYTLQAHLMLRMDRLERNLLELPHRGTAAGADLVSGYRRNWRDWGPKGTEQAGNGRSYQSCTGYFLAAGGVPGIDSDRHRLVGALHAGTGHNLDRFSAIRVGGGPNPMGEEYGSSADPVLPGAVVHEFFPDHYLLLLAEYRFEPVFFSYLGFSAAYGRLDRLRQTKAGIRAKTDSFTVLGARLTSGLPFHSRLQLSYAYNFSVVREGGYGSHEVVVNVSRPF